MGRWSYEAGNRDLEVISVEGFWGCGYVWKTPAAEENWVLGRGVSPGQMRKRYWLRKLRSNEQGDKTMKTENWPFDKVTWRVRTIIIL